MNDSHQPSRNTREGFSIHLRVRLNGQTASVTFAVLTSFLERGCMKRYAFLRPALAVGLLACLSGGPAALTASDAPAAKTAGAKDPLLFPKDKFTVETAMVKTATGEKKVVYHSYQHLLYVTKPVDKNYESLDVKVPVSIDGEAIDASHAPIVFIVGVGGYMSSPNIRDASTMMGGRGGPSGPAGPGGPGGPPSGDMAGGPGGQRGPLSGGPNGAPGGPGGPGNNNAALAEGYVIVNPGVRGRNNQAKDGTYYGKAPAAIVDLKAAVRYIRHNAGVLPGNVDWIISTGCSAGGGLSALLGASGNSPLYEPYLKEIGAAEAPDNIFASDCHSPVTDLDHADLSYEWEFGASKGASIDKTVSAELKERFTAYETSLHLQGKDNFGVLTADNLSEYMVEYYLAPSATQYLLSLTEDKRKEYLAKNPWLEWDGKNARFTLAEFAAQHINRFKSAPAFDDFTMKSPETILFGNKTTNAQHFTNYSLQHTSGNPNATLDPEFQKVVNTMNPMYFVSQKNAGAAIHWRFRHGAIETDSSAVGPVDIGTGLENMGRDVNTALYWDAGHCQDLDPQGFLTWIAQITSYKVHP